MVRMAKAISSTFCEHSNQPFSVHMNDHIDFQIIFLYMHYALTLTTFLYTMKIHQGL